MLTIQQASQLTGKSEKTIRRLVKHLLETDKDTSGKIERVPYPGGFTYQIDKEYLLTHTQSPTQPATHEPRQGQPQDAQPATHQDSQLLKAKDETIAFLKAEVDRLHEEIRELLERDKERNILFHKFQDALMLEAPKTRVDGGKLIVQELNSQDGQEGRQEGQPKQQTMDTNHKQKKSKARKPEQPKKRGFLSFLRGK